MRNRIYMWCGFAFLLCVAVLVHEVTRWGWEPFTRSHPNPHFALSLPFNGRLSGLWWIWALPAVWFVVATLLHKRVCDSTKLAVIYVITALVASVVLAFSLPFVVASETVM